MIELPEYVDKTWPHHRYLMWYVSGRPERFVKKLFWDREINRAITEEEYETQRVGGRLRYLNSSWWKNRK